MVDMKEPDPSLLNIRELRDRSVNEELHTSSSRQPSPGPIHVHCTVQNLKKYIGICLPLPLNKTTPASVSIISPKSSSDIDTDQDEIIDETPKSVVHQMLLKTTTSSPTSILNLHDTLHDKTPERKSVPALNPSDLHKHTTASPNHSYRPDSLENWLTHPTTNFEQTKHTINGHRCFITFPPPHVTESYRN